MSVSTVTPEDRLRLFTQVCYAVIAGYTVWVVCDVAFDGRPSGWLRAQGRRLADERRQRRQVKRDEARVVFEAMEIVDEAKEAEA